MGNAGKAVVRILFVCHGNICRSPMAELFLKDLAAKKGVSDRFEIASAATTGEEIVNGVGNPVYPPAVRELARHGISPAGKRARRLLREDYGRYDLIVGMDEENMEDMRRLFGGDPEGKLSLLLEHAGLNRAVADPWFTGDFRTAWNDVETGCLALFREILGTKGEKRI
ncbi:MAG: low molecular weight phosphotyrosine protein phosphatase [Clostridia bacterium]|nr:low molecular weight phosphotyrosine protein phosphatase [Clostridia bacterium]